MHKPVINSPYLVEKLQATEDENLFNHVKFNLINDIFLQNRGKKINILELGCGTQVTARYLKRLGAYFNYFGADYEDAFRPDLVCDLLTMEGIKEQLPWEPDYLLLLDVLEHLSEDTTVLDQVIKNCSELISPKTKVIVTLPQMYRLDRLKFPHLHYPEHKIRLTQQEWSALLGKHFQIDKVQGVGFLSVIPFLPMFSKQYKPDNKLGRLFLHLRKNTMERPVFKPMDLWFSRKLGTNKLFSGLSNDILFELSYKR